MKLARKTLAILLLFVGLVLLNLIVSLVPGQADLTDEKLYTLSEGSHALLAKVGEPITLRFYFSRSLEGLPTFFKNYATRVQDLLRQFAAASNGQVKLEIIDPRPDTPEEEAAIKAGLNGQPIPTGENLFFGLLAIQADQERTIPMFNMERESFLEFDIAQLIYQVGQIAKPKIGILTGLEIFRVFNPQMMDAQQSEGDWAIIEELRKTYDVEQMTGDEVPAGIDVLAVIHPKEPTEGQVYAIDQFLLSGKPLLLVLDPSSVSARMKMNPQMMMMGQPGHTSSNLPRLLNRWGIQYAADKVVGDFNYAAPVSSGRGGRPTPFAAWLSLTAFDKTSPITGQLKQMLIPEAGSFSVRQDSGLTMTPLITTSPDSGEINASGLMYATPEGINKQLKADNQRRTLAGIVRGTFKTAFPEGKPVPVQNEEDKEKTPPPPPPTAPTIQESTGSCTLIVLGDADFMANQFAVREMNFFGMKASSPINDNLTFTVNLFDFLAGSQDLVALRGKGSSFRPFTRVQAMEKDAQKAYQERIDALETRLNEVQKQLRDLQAQAKDQGQLVASSQAREAIEKFRLEEAKLRSERRQINKTLRESIERLNLKLATVNLVIIPLVVALSGVAFFTHRARKRK